MKQSNFRVMFGIGVALLLLVLTPIIWTIVSAGIGLLAIGGIGVTLLAAIQMIPLLGQKLENFVLKQRKAEARQNPIEQLQLFLKEKAQQVYDFKQAVISIGGQIKSLQAMVNDRIKTRPNYDATPQLNSIKAMIDAHTVLNQKYVNAEKALEELKIAIQDKEFEWKFSQAGQAAMASLNATSGKELMEQMLADEAFSSVTENFNSVFAELEMEAQHLSDTKQISFGNGLTLDMTSINLSSIKV